jgi:cytochrome c
MNYRLAFPLTASIAVLAASAASTAPPPPKANPAGAALYKQRCQMCHNSVAGQPALLGPNLAGLGGRKAGATGFNYSTALKASGLVWTKANLDKYLTAPGKMVPGTRMVISVSDAKQRAALVDYLATLPK